MDERAVATGLGVALGIGLLIGLDRERRMAATGTRGVGGIRTFALVALVGGVADLVGGIPLVVAVLLVLGAVVAVAYALGGSEDRGLTTEVALLVTLLLGVLAQRDALLAAGMAVVVTILLATRSGLHRFASSVLTEEEVHDGLLLGAAALVLWPLMPDRELAVIGVNPFSVWRLVVLLMSVSAGGYVAVRAAGPRLGLPLAGLAGGFVSSSATIAAMGGRAKDPVLLRPAIAGALASTVATMLQAAGLFALTAGGGAALVLAWPLGLGGLAALVIAMAFAVRATPGNEVNPSGRAFDPRVALAVATAITVMTAVARVAGDAGGSAGLLVVSLLGGLADAHAPVVAVASLVATGHIDAQAAVVPALAALSSNTVTKIVSAYLSGGRLYASLVGAGLLAVLVAAWIGWAIASM